MSEGVPELPTQELSAMQPDITEVLQYIAEENARRNKAALRWAALPLAVCVVGTVYEYQYGFEPEPKPPTYDCRSFEPDVLLPPAHGALGFSNAGRKLNSTELTTDGMTTRNDVMLASGAPVKSKQSGLVVDKNGVLTGTLDLPPDYAASIVDSMQYDPIRWGVCNLGGGVVFTTTDRPEFSNGDFQTSKDAAELIFVAGNKDPLFDNERQIGYVEMHELGHAVREDILKETNNPEPISLVNQLDTLYAQQASMVAGDYATAHGEEVSQDLNTLLTQFESLSPDIANKAAKQKVKAAIGYIQTELRNPADFGQFAIGTEIVDKGSSSKETYVLSLDGMISKASMALSPEDPMYGLAEYFQDNPNLLDQTLLTRNDDALKKMMKTAFLSEQVMPGDQGGHTYDDSNELFASAWSITGLVSEDNFDKVTAAIPAPYKEVVMQQLQTVRKIRETIDPTTFGQPLGANPSQSQ